MNRGDAGDVDPNTEYNDSEDSTYDGGYAVEEGKEDYYLDNPALYKIGINRECFSKLIFIKWIIYALWHGLVVFVIVHFGLLQP